MRADASWTGVCIWAFSCYSFEFDVVYITMGPKLVVLDRVQKNYARHFQSSSDFAQSIHRCTPTSRIGSLAQAYHSLQKA